MSHPLKSFTSKGKQLRAIKPRQHLGFKKATPVVDTTLKEAKQLSMIEEIISRGGGFRNLREAMGYTLKDIEVMSQGRVKKGTLTAIESGETIGPRMTTMFFILRVYGITMDDCLALLTNLHKHRYLA